MKTHKPYGPYEAVVKPILGWLLALLFVLLFGWVYIVLAVLVRIKLGAPVLFVQERPGQIDPRTGTERIIKLYKFRSMTSECGPDGNLLPDDKRLTHFGKELRSTSLDELPEILFNILIFRNMAWIGPRPLLVRYLPRYSEDQHHRHDVKPGITGYAQVHGRNCISWESKFDMDLKYVSHVTFWGDVKIVFKTIRTIISRDNISIDVPEFMGEDE